jgi:hypothetical protein
VWHLVEVKLNAKSAPCRWSLINNPNALKERSRSSLVEPHRQAG